DCRATETDRARAAVAEEPITFAQTESAHDLQEVANIPRASDRSLFSRLVDAHVRLEPVEKQHVPAQFPEAEDVLKEHPGVASTVRLLRKRSSDGNGFHRRVTASVDDH